ncbi:d-aminoacyl-tRNA deacylase 1 [Anaeramoeba flamelloides]|uniref:D-aminoacyl-tRNA deacylase n=1 Tax=Anaeramoeba flamelloides TaxID=1746091 RepID=A0AAV7ZFE5_9EUKA|nr:d-aminoacyl-tRNA deacylase [Anaeramoeba flamelloides]KAJ6247883.1 d-aminoacyl-tRNA deacylase 1 [Anaeramoeba flamelloides]
MKIVITRVSSASVTVENEVVGSIEKGILALVGICKDDTKEDLEYIIKKLINIRLWADPKTNKPWSSSVKSLGLPVLLISQFTLFARTKKGNKPDFHLAMGAEKSSPMFENFCKRVGEELGDQNKVQQGVFGAMMKVESINDGPVTITIDSKNR